MSDQQAKPPRGTPGTARPAAPQRPFLRRCDDIGRHGHKTFLYSVTAGLLAFIAWANLVQLDKVTRGLGRVIPSTSNQIVQHLEGGIVAEIMVRQGAAVAEGDIIVRLSNSFSQAEESKVELELAAARLALMRLDAETAGADALTFAPELATRHPDLADNELRLFDKRHDNLGQQLLILKDETRGKQLEYEELKARYGSRARERELIATQVDNLKKLVKIGAASTNALIEKQTELQRAEGEITDLDHQIPRTEAAFRQAERKESEARLAFRTDAEKERNDVRLKIAQLEATLNAMNDRDHRYDVRAPIAGIVNRLAVSTVGGVVKPGEEIAEIVPADKAVSIEARLSPKDRAEVWPGLPALIKITAYDYSVDGGLEGKVTEISPDALSDEKGEPYFRVRLEAGASNFGPDKPVVPGMTAEVDILSGRHTVMSYLLRPISRMSERALRQ
jgi:HlyD family type I secretion membrane fusion protein